MGNLLKEVPQRLLEEHVKLWLLRDLGKNVNSESTVGNTVTMLLNGLPNVGLRAKVFKQLAPHVGMTFRFATNWRELDIHTHARRAEISGRSRHVDTEAPQLSPK